MYFDLSSLTVRLSYSFFLFSKRHIMTHFI
nr:MAG TPA: hypothetical protein [Crassvirales sp.]